MKGSRHIRISNRKLTYEFTIRRNLTIIRGDSATGKTTLIGMIREFNLQGEDSGVQVSSSSPCVVVEGQNWEKQLRELDEDSVVFIDEGNRFVSSRRFAEVARASSNYYVIVTRENLYSLPYSVTEIYGIHSAGKYNSIQKVYHEFYRIYGEKNNAGLEKVNEIITEGCILPKRGRKFECTGESRKIREERGFSDCGWSCIRPIYGTTGYLSEKALKYSCLPSGIF